MLQLSAVLSWNGKKKWLLCEENSLLYVKKKQLTSKWNRLLSSRYPFTSRTSQLGAPENDCMCKKTTKWKRDAHRVGSATAQQQD